MIIKSANSLEAHGEGQELEVNQDVKLELPGSGVRGHLNEVLAYLYDLMFIDNDVPDAEDIDYIKSFEYLKLNGDIGHQYYKIINTEKVYRA